MTGQANRARTQLDRTQQWWSTLPEVCVALGYKASDYIASADMEIRAAALVAAQFSVLSDVNATCTDLDGSGPFGDLLTGANAAKNAAAQALSDAKAIETQTTGSSASTNVKAAQNATSLVNATILSSANSTLALLTGAVPAADINTATADAQAGAATAQPNCAKAYAGEALSFNPAGSPAGNIVGDSNDLVAIAAAFAAAVTGLRNVIIAKAGTGIWPAYVGDPLTDSAQAIIGYFNTVPTS